MARTGTFQYIHSEGIIRTHYRRRVIKLVDTDYILITSCAEILKPRFHIAFQGLYGSLDMLSLCQLFAIAEGLSGSLRVISFISFLFAERRVF